MQQIILGLTEALNDIEVELAFQEIDVLVSLIPLVLREIYALWLSN